MNKFTLASILILTYFIACQCDTKPFWPENKSLELVSKKVTEDLLSRDGYMMYDTENVKAVHYAEVCAAYGAAKIAGLLNDTITLSRISKRYLKVIEDSIPNTENHVDANVYGILPLELYMQGQDQIYYDQGMHLADDQWKDPLDNGLTNQTRFWIDDIWMIGSLQIQAYRATGKQIYLDRAAKEIVAYLEKLQQPNGLFHHGENAPFFWGRGNGWVAAGLAILISELPKNHPDYPAIESGYVKMMNSLLNYQTEEGMWRQLVDVDSSWVETSSSAMFGYAFIVGVKKGVLPGKDFKPAYEKAWLSLVDYITDDGKISDVCVGTGQSLDINYYLDRPTVIGDLHGQAPMLWFAYELME